jgi:hypothetical protein
MANVIWKQRLPNPLHEGYAPVLISMPIGAVPLSVADQHGELTMWVMLDPQEPFGTRQFEVIGTGMQMCELNRKFIGTVLLRAYVWHVFEVLGQQSEEGTNERN